MFIGVGVGAYWAGVYHLLTHAFFKATLFLGSGSVILGCHHQQDMRKMGGLRKLMPTTHWTYLVACIAIAGFPVANGFYSKDEILWKAFTSQHLTLFGFHTPWLGVAIYLAGIVAATGTSFYMFRSYYMTFTGEYRGGEGHDDHGAQAAPAAGAHATAGQGHDAHGHDAHGHAAPAHGGHGHGDHGHAAPVHGGHDDHGHAAAAHGDAHGGHGGGPPRESPRTITWVLATLAVGSVLTLFLGLPMLWTHRPPLLEHWLEPVLLAEVPFVQRPHSWEWVFQGLGVLAGTVGWVFARWLYKDNRSTIPATLQKKLQGAWTVVYNKYYVDELYDATVVRPSVFLARFLSWFDGHIIDWLVNFAGWITRIFANIDGAIDKYLVDGAVNALAAVTIESGRALRKVQTGRIQTYLYGALAGGLAVVLLNFLIR